MRFHELLTEKNRELSQVIAAAIRANASLSDEAKDVIVGWENANWSSGKLEKAYSGTGSSELKQEIETAFKPVREVMHRVYGDTVPLYRGQVTVSPENLDVGRTLFSWTSDVRIAQKFSRGSMIAVITDQQIEEIVRQYDRTGFAKFGPYRYVRSIEYPGYFNIFKRRNFITDGDDLHELLKSEQKDQREYNERIRSQGEVVADRVPVDAIVWITNRLNCQEFICAWNPLAHRTLSESTGSFTAEQAKDIGDCAVIALTYLTGRSWDEVWEIAKKHFNRYGMNSGAISATARDLGWRSERSFWQIMGMGGNQPMNVRQAQAYLQKHDPDVRLICMIHVNRVPHSIAFVDGEFHNVQDAWRARVHLASVFERN